MPVATMTSKGQITIPSDIRSRFRLLPGVKVDFGVNASGEIVMRPKTRDIRELRGILKHLGPPLSLEDLDRGIAEAVAERTARR